MIASEMTRGARLRAPADRERLRSAYERILQLADLTVQVADRAALRRELLRWRDLVAGLYVAAVPDPPSRATALRALLRLAGGAAKRHPPLLPTTARAGGPLASSTPHLPSVASSRVP